MNNPIHPQSSRSATTKKIILSLVILLLILVIGSLSWQRFATQRNKQNSLVNKAIENLYSIKVGNELIYKEDLTKMISLGLVAFPSVTQPELEKLAQGKIIYESIVLQGAETDGLIKLDSSVFNSSAKNYTKRKQLVEEVRQKVTNESQGPKGTVVEIWFDLQATSSTQLNYATRQKMALDKITDMHQAVQNHTMTIQQAAKSIQAYSSLSNLDPSYKANASFDFAPTAEEAITTYPEFDKVLNGLKTDEVSDIFPAPKIVGGKKTSTIAGYMFGEVTKIVNNNTIISFDDWLNKKSALYKVIIQ